MARSAPSVDTHPRKTTAESRRDNRRITIDSLFARQPSQCAPSSSPSGPSPSDGKLRLSGPRIKKGPLVATPTTRARASLSRSCIKPSENAHSLSQTVTSDTTPAMQTRSNTKDQDRPSQDGSRGMGRFASATNASRIAKTSASPPSSGLRSSHEGSPSKGLPRKRTLPLGSNPKRGATVPHHVPTQPTSQARTSPRTTTRTSSTKPLAPRGNVLPSPSDSASSRKRPRLAPPEAYCGLQAENLKSSQAIDPYEVVPSSQSDEQELTIAKVTKKDPAAVKEAVNQWRREAETDPRMLVAEAEVPMNVDEIPGSPLSSLPTGLQTPRSEVKYRGSSPSPYTLSSPGSCHTTLATSILTAGSLPSPPTRATPASLLSFEERPLTPPLNNRNIFSPSTVVALNEESKTAQIIAEIKARAYATVSSSPDTIPDELRELGYSDSSSEESEENFMAAFIKGKRRLSHSPLVKKTVRSGSPASVYKPLQRTPDTPRYSLRQKVPGTEHAGNKRMPTLVSAGGTPGKRSRKADPLGALLKEKQRAEKRGGGEDALRAAEAAIVSSSKDKQDAKANAKASLKREMDSEDSEDVDPAWTDERAAMDVVQKNSQRFKSRSSSPLLGFDWDEDSDDESGGELDDARRRVLDDLGAEGGRKVVHILAGNRLLREAMSNVKSRDCILGVPLWDDLLPREDDSMQVDNLPALTFTATDVHMYPLLGLLQDAAREDDAPQLSMLLHSGVLSTLQPAHAAVLVPWLLVAATDPAGRPYSELAYQMLLQLARSASQAEPKPGAFVSILADILIRLGAKSNVCEELGRSFASRSKPVIEAQLREHLCDRAISSITALARENGLPLAELPATILLLVLVALDRTTAPDLRREVMIAVEAIGQTIPTSDEGKPIEAAIHSRLVNFAKTQAPMNQAYILSFIPGGCSQTNRIARNVARTLLLKDETYTPLPCLSPIVDLLSPPSGSASIFDIQGNAGKADYYEDLTCYVEILSKALTDIASYTALEREALAGRMPLLIQGEESPRKGPASERDPTPLEQIKTLLDSLHGKIVDTRAAFLDRSRAKAALQRLSLRVHYQRMAGLRSGPGTGKPRNLRNYFAQPKGSAGSSPLPP